MFAGRAKFRDLKARSSFPFVMRERQTIERNQFPIGFIIIIRHINSTSQNVYEASKR